MRRPDTRRHRWAGVAIAAPVCEPRAADNLNITAQIRGPKGREETMGKRFGTLISRRAMIGGGAASVAATLPTGWAIAQAKPLKVGLMLPYSGTFAKLGENITYAIEMLIAEKGGKLGGREIQIIKLDDESKPENAPQNADRLVKRDRRRRADRHRPLGRADGHPQGGAGQRHADHRAQRRQRGGDAQAVRQERVPLLLHELAAGLRHGRRRRQEGPSRRASG